MLRRKIFSAANLIIAGVLFVGIIILANAALTGWRIDLTENKLFTLSEGTVNILDALEEPIRLDFYFSQKALTGYPNLSNYGARVRYMLQEYATRANGMIRLNVIDPEVFSEEEDQAVAGGMQSISLNQAGERAYFGLVGTNSTDDEKIIPLFQTNRESALEYDISKLIYNLAYPDKRVVGILSSLPIFGDPEAELQKWTIIDTIGEFFKVRQLDLEATPRLDGIDILMIVHPKALSDETLFAIDQYILKGGKAMIFIDPMAEEDKTKPDPERGVLPDLDSDLEPLTSAWGLTLVEQKIAGDIDSAMHVQARIGDSNQQVIYLPWLKLAKKSMNQNDFATSLIKVIHIGTAGILEHEENSDLQFSPLIQTTKKSMQIERDLFYIQRDPRVFLDNFESANKRQTIAMRLRGIAKTAYADGLPQDEPDDEENGANDASEDATKNLVKEGDINVIVVADTDILSDKFWIRKRRLFGLEIPQTIANNGDFIVNALENMSGNNDLSGLRARGEYTRPFERVEEIRREAELEYREREQTLKKTLRETEEKIRALRQEQNSGEQTTTTVLLTPEQSAEIKKFQTLRIDTRKQLRSVQHALKKNIESLDTKLRFFNILFLPLLITLAAIGFGLYRSTFRKTA